jgi:hypothetical protein
VTSIANISVPNAVNYDGNSALTNDQRRALALKVFSGEVFTAYNNATIFKGLVRNYTLRGAKSKQFLFSGTLTAGYHVPGTPLLGDDPLKVNEKTILMDDLLVASQFVYDLDEVLSHYNQRAEIAKQMGEALAQHYDVRIARVLDIASREASVVTGEPGGFEVSIGAANQFNAQAIVDGLFESAAVLDERNAPQEGRKVILSPRQYYSLISSVDTNILNREFGNDQGDLNSGKGLYSIAGIRIYKSNNLPFMAAYNSAVTGENNDYTDANATCCGLVFHTEAAGVVEAIGPSVETTSGDFHVQYQGDLLVAKLAMGAGSLNVKLAGSLQAQT